MDQGIYAFFGLTQWLDTRQELKNNEGAAWKFVMVMMVCCEMKFSDL